MSRPIDPRPSRPGGRLRAVSVVVSVVAGLVTTTGAGTTRGSPHDAALSALEAEGILENTRCYDGSNCPDQPIPRWVMAVWLSAG